MPNHVVYAGFNQSKHQMHTGITIDGLAPPVNPQGTEIALVTKNLTASFNQVALKSRFFEIINAIRDSNTLNQIANGDFVGSSHLQVTVTRDGAVTQNIIYSYDCWTPMTDDSVSVNIPVESGWAKEGSTVYLDNVAKRLYEKLRETYLVYS